MKIPRKIYYAIKPVIPRSIQIYVRRKSLQTRLPRYKNVWPILERAKKKTDNWLGWPEGKQFAFVLTHDVEHKRGYDQVLTLMKIEQELGFVSSFNFVPERDYSVENELLQILKVNGFEYGIHGLYHDGKLFSSEEEFLRRAEKINRYIHEWGASGFRAPAMHNNLELIGALNIDYDLSTFDTDPFEPQPDGVETIFPFWVENKRNEKGGYVELPYTLPQDFTTFILMREKNISIWQKKTEWIAENGGMVLVNVHPDYINFNNSKSTREQFPIALYTNYLKYVSENFSGKYWNPLPRSVAENFTKKQSTNQR